MGSHKPDCCLAFTLVRRRSASPATGGILMAIWNRTPFRNRLEEMFKNRLHAVSKK